MPFYRIKEITIPAEKDTYYVYQGNEEIEVRLNRGFTIAKEILEHLANSNNASVYLWISYQNECLSYIVECTEDEFKSLSTIGGCLWEEAPSQALPQTDTVLSGAALPLVLKDREENLLDELVSALDKNDDFLIKISLTFNIDVDNKIILLENRIKDLSQMYKKNIAKQPDIVKNFLKGLRGGDNDSTQEVDINLQLEYEQLENHYYCLKTQGAIFQQVSYEICANLKVANIIRTKLYSYSQRSGSSSIYKIKELPKPSSNHVTSNSFLNQPYLKYVTSNLVASIIAVPISGIPGVKVNKHCEFGADIDYNYSSEKDNEDDRLVLGKLYKKKQTCIPVSIDWNDLTQHAFVTGVTGSGKTSTIKHMLLEAAKKDIPFLVIEPAKREYQYLKTKCQKLNSYTLGIEGENSFKINPFEFPEGMHIQTHLDHLKSIFIAAFPMYGPMPYILETAFYDIYNRTGWDFISSHNRYKGTLERAELFPTLEDLYLAIDKAISKVGYSHDLSNDVKGALKVRVGSLLKGAKGLILNTRTSKSIPDLLKEQAIIELEFIGDNQEKVFLMGLLLVSIYEHYISLQTHSEKLKNLLVIEEAHRLLENTISSNNQEVSDMKGKAVETFNNILAEIRTYGQGLIITDQIPTKLSPDVIKNTNLKIVHRLFAKDDREIVGHTIGIEDEQIKEFVRLKDREAVVFHGRIDEAMQVKVDNIDPSVLAQNQSNPFERKNPDVQKIDYILGQDLFKEKISRIINTIILFPACKDKISNFLKCEIEALGNFNSSSKETNIEQSIRDLLIKSLKFYIRKNKLYEKINYSEEILLYKEIDGTSDTFNVFFRFMEKFASEITHHKMSKYAASYESLGILINVLNLSLKEVHNIFVEFGDNFKTDNQAVNNAILDVIARKNLFKDQWLTTEEKKQLCSGIVLYSFPNNFLILEHYFGVKKGYYSTETVMEIKKQQETRQKELSSPIETETNQSLASICECLKSLEQLAICSDRNNQRRDTSKILAVASIVISIIAIIVVLINSM